MAYDVIIVGARCAGSPLGMLLSRAGRSVLVVDRASFPSDTLSTHYVRPEGAGLLAQWGLLDRVMATGCPPLTHMKITGRTGQLEDVAYPAGIIGLCPRRTVIDDILVKAAREAGAEVRERFSMTDVVRDGSGCVIGITGRDGEGRDAVEEAAIVVGADGLHSKLAQLVQPEEYNQVDSLVCAYWSYFSGIDIGPRVEILEMPGAGMLTFPTHDGLACVAAVRPVEDFAAYRADIQGMFAQTVASFGPDATARMQAAKREERWYGTADVPYHFRKPYGPGWALVGDAGFHVDPTLGLGMSKAFSEASILAPALVAALEDPAAFDAHLRRFHEERDATWFEEAQNTVYVSSMQAKKRPVQLQPYPFP
jgi:2-polyprenyl-6-methoxyphenol hydroxylase-like FAD-dependent oxidoreductase